MSTEYINHVKQLFSDIHEETMKSLRINDKEYSELLRCSVEESRKVEKIINCLDDEDRELVLRHKERHGRMEWIEREMLYFQGLKDCVKLLSFLEVI
ncbi:hypothetical protein R9X47_22780 [Wukongibacter baidiensis]|uniref:hypothetical protein n=1 Tax=Wukongibacter baidiensis TaxID=1723361 RepID=UPI003D7F5A34